VSDHHEPGHVGQPATAGQNAVHDDQGVGPWPGGRDNWPDDDRFDPDLLEHGDRRNVVDHYRYWRVEAIKADLDNRRHPFHVAIENWGRDFNIGSVVRSANAFGAAAVHIVGRRRWNRRGAMVTDRYQHIHHHETVEDLLGWAQGQDLPIIGVDNLPGSVPLEHRALPKACVLLFGEERAGLSPDAQAASATIVHITQYGSTRSINAGAAAAVAMYHWALQHARVPIAGQPET